MSAGHAGKPKTWRHWLYVNLHPSARHRRGLSPLNRLVVLVILLAVGLAILQSEPMLYAGNEGFFRAAEIVLATIFLAEYAARIWIAGENPDYGPSIAGRLRYALTLPALVDLVVLVSLFVTLVGSEGAVSGSCGSSASSRLPSSAATRPPSTPSARPSIRVAMN